MSRIILGIGDCKDRQCSDPKQSQTVEPGVHLDGSRPCSASVIGAFSVAWFANLFWKMFPFLEGLSPCTKGQFRDPVTFAGVSVWGWGAWLELSHRPKNNFPQNLHCPHYLLLAAGKKWDVRSSTLGLKPPCRFTTTPRSSISLVRLTCLCFENDFAQFP